MLQRVLRHSFRPKFRAVFHLHHPLRSRCESGMTSPRPTSQTYGGVCAAGYACPAGSSVQSACVPGQYQPQAQQATCLDCPGGALCNGTGACKAGRGRRGCFSVCTAAEMSMCLGGQCTLIVSYAALLLWRLVVINDVNTSTPPVLEQPSSRPRPAAPGRTAPSAATSRRCCVPRGPLRLLAASQTSPSAQPAQEAPSVQWPARPTRRASAPRATGARRSRRARLRTRARRATFALLARRHRSRARQGPTSPCRCSRPSAPVCPARPVAFVAALRWQPSRATAAAGTFAAQTSRHRRPSRPPSWSEESRTAATSVPAAPCAQWGRRRRCRALLERTSEWVWRVEGWGRDESSSDGGGLRVVGHENAFGGAMWSSE